MKSIAALKSNFHLVPAGSGFTLGTNFKKEPLNVSINLKAEKNEKYS